MTPHQLYQEKRRTVEQALSLIHSDTVIGATYVCEPGAAVPGAAPSPASGRNGLVLQHHQGGLPLLLRSRLSHDTFFSSTASSTTITGAGQPAPAAVSYLPFHMHQMPGIAGEPGAGCVFMMAVPPMDAGATLSDPIQQFETEVFPPPRPGCFNQPHIPFLPAPAKGYLISEMRLPHQIRLHLLRQEFMPSAVEQQAAANAAALVPRTATPSRSGARATCPTPWRTLSTKKNDARHLHRDLLRLRRTAHAARVVTNRRTKNFPPDKTVCGFLWGDQPFLHFLDHNPDIELLPSAYVNDPIISPRTTTPGCPSTPPCRCDLTGPGALKR